jgi:hypothetical protein
MEKAMTDRSFDFGDTAIIACSGEIGTVIGKATYPNREDSYLIHYKAADGRAQECWWEFSTLLADVPSTATGMAETASRAMQTVSPAKGPRLAPFKVEGAQLEVERAANGGWVVYDTTTRKAFCDAPQMIGSFSSAGEMIRAFEAALTCDETQPA